MTWTQRLKRVFGIDIETILTRLEANTFELQGYRLPSCRAPPQASLFD